jgi:hypothetical protein
MTARQHTWVGVLAVGQGRQAPLAGASALSAHGMRGVNSEPVHVLIPARMRDTDPPPWVVVHRTKILPPPDRHHGLPPRTAVARSVVDAACWAPSDDQARAIIASAFQQRLVDRAAIVGVLGRLGKIRRQRLIEQTVLDAGGGSESISELELLDLCRGGGLPLPQRQSVVLDSDGRRRYRDGYYEEWRVHIEIDGSQHMTILEDCDYLAALTCQGRLKDAARVGTP